VEFSDSTILPVIISGLKVFDTNSVVPLRVTVPAKVSFFARLSPMVPLRETALERVTAYDDPVPRYTPLLPLTVRVPLPRTPLLLKIKPPPSRIRFPENDDVAEMSVRLPFPVLVRVLDPINGAHNEMRPRTISHV